MSWQSYGSLCQQIWISRHQLCAVQYCTPPELTSSAERRSPSSGTESNYTNSTLRRTVPPIKPNELWSKRHERTFLMTYLTPCSGNDLINMTWLPMMQVLWLYKSCYAGKQKEVDAGGCEGGSVGWIKYGSLCETMFLSMCCCVLVLIKSRCPLLFPRRKAAVTPRLCKTITSVAGEPSSSCVPTVSWCWVKALRTNRALKVEAGRVWCEVCSLIFSSKDKLLHVF